MGCGGSAQRVAPLTLEAVSEQDHGGMTLLRMNTKGDVTTEKRPSTPSTNADPLETQSIPSIEGAEGGLRSPSKPRKPISSTLPGASDEEQKGADWPPEPVIDSEEPVSGTAQNARTGEPVSAEDPKTPEESNATPTTAKAPVPEQVEPAPVVLEPPSPPPAATPVVAKMVLSQCYQKEEALELDPAAKKLLSQIEKLEKDVVSQLDGAGAIQKRAWRNKRQELSEKLEASTSSGELKQTAQSRLEGVQAQLDGASVPAPRVPAA